MTVDFPTIVSENFLRFFSEEEALGQLADIARHLGFDVRRPRDADQMQKLSAYLMERGYPYVFIGRALSFATARMSIQDTVSRLRAQASQDDE